MIKPITPDQVADQKITSFPPEVFEAFNELIALHFTDGSARVNQTEVVNLIKGKMNIKIFNSNWLNVEDAYRAAGWKVFYDKPSYCESYEAYFEFTKK